MYFEHFIPLNGFKFAPANLRSRTLDKSLLPSALKSQNVVDMSRILEYPQASQDSLQKSFQPSGLKSSTISNDSAGTQDEHSRIDQTQILRSKNLHPTDHEMLITPKDQVQRNSAAEFNTKRPSTKPHHQDDDEKYHALRAQIASLAEQNVVYRGQLVNKTQECEEVKQNYSTSQSQLQAYKAQISRLKVLASDVRQDCYSLCKSSEKFSQNITAIKQDIAVHIERLSDASQICQTAVKASEKSQQCICDLRVAVAEHGSVQTYFAEIRQGLADIVGTKQNHRDLSTYTSQVVEILQTIQQHVSSSRVDTEVIKAACVTIEPAQISVRNELQSLRSERLNDHSSQMDELVKLGNKLESFKPQIDHLQAVQKQNQGLSERLEDAETTIKTLDQEKLSLKASLESAISKALSETNTEREQNESLQTTNRGLEEDIKRKSDEIIEVRLELESLKQISEAQVSQLAEKEKAQQNFELDMNVLKQGHFDELVRGRQKFNELNTSLIEALREKEDLEAKQREQAAQVASKDDETDELKTQIDTLQKSLKSRSSFIQLDKPPIQNCVKILDTANSHAIYGVESSRAEGSTISSVQTSVQNFMQYDFIPRMDDEGNREQMDDNNFDGLSQDIVLSLESTVDRCRSQSVPSRNVCQPDQVHHDPICRVSRAKSAEIEVIPKTQDDAAQTESSVPTLAGSSLSSSEGLDHLFNELIGQSSVTRTNACSSVMHVVRHVTFVPESRPATANHEMLLRSSDVVDFGRNSEAKSRLFGLGRAEDHNAAETGLPSPSHSCGNNQQKMAIKREATNEDAAMNSPLKKIKHATPVASLRTRTPSTIRTRALLPSRLTKGGRGRAFHGSKKHASHFGGEASHNPGG